MVLVSGILPHISINIKPVLIERMKVKVNIKGLGSVEIEEDNPNNFAKFLESIEEFSIKKNAVGDQLETSFCTPKPMVLETKDIKSNSITIDSVADYEKNGDFSIAEKWTNQITKYVRSKSNYEHDLSELMVNVVGKPIKKKEYPRSYETFHSKVRLVRNRIEKRENIEWESERKHNGTKSLPLIYKIKKSNNQSDQNEHQSEKFDLMEIGGE